MKKVSIENINHSYEDWVQLESRNKDLAGLIVESDNLNNALLSKISDLEERILEINNSRSGKIVRNIQKIKFILSTVHSGKGIFSIFFFFFSSAGFKLITKFIAKSLKFVTTDDSACPVKKTPQTYSEWYKKNTADNALLSKYSKELSLVSYKPILFTIIPIFKINSDDLIKSVSSVKNQIYQNWECVIVTSSNCHSFVMSELKKIDLLFDLRIKVVVFENACTLPEHINAAVRLSDNVDYIHLLKSGDILPPDAMYHYVKLINNHPDAALIYGDEDYYVKGRHLNPNFKPDFSPHSLLSFNYIANSVLFSRKALAGIHFFSTELGDSFVYDAVLKISENSNQLYHIDRILYHNDIAKKNTGITDHVNDLNVIRKAIKRRDELAYINVEGYRSFIVRYALVNQPKVSILIPTKDKANVLKQCLNSVLEKSTYKNIEVILIENNSKETATYDLIADFESRFPGKFFCYSYEESFNFSKINNWGVKKATGDYVVFLNNDTEVIDEDWIQSMLEYAQKDNVGAVGVKLLYPDDKIQHGGMVIGLEYGGNTFVGEDRYSSGYQNYLISVKNYSAVTAACMMVNKKLFLSVGGFDEEFAIEYNDTDFCLRLINASLYNVFLPHVRLYHYESLSRGYSYLSKKALNVHRRETETFTTRWQKYIAQDPCYNRNLSKAKGGFGINY